nr:ThiF family adenylyltransferase [Bacilli bacterium]
MFDRLIKLIGEDNFNKIQNTRVLLIGVGGVGSAALETLVRNGFTKIQIIDYDTVDITNLNRQLIT